MLRFLLREFEQIVCVALLIGMTALGFVNIVVRYATDMSFAASEELLTSGFLLLTVFGGAIAARRGGHLAVTAIEQALPPLPRKVVFLLSVTLSVGLLSLSALFCWQLVKNQISSGVRSYALQVPMWYYSAALPLGFLLTLVRSVQHAADVLRGTDYADVPHV